MKKKLQAMLESIINEDVDKASKHFHSYLSEMIAHETGMEYKDEESSDDEVSSEISSDDEGSEEKCCACGSEVSSDDESSSDDEVSSDVESEYKEEEM